ncbi:glutathione synthase [Streptomyces sp. CB02923]|uniref:ATP-grasp domain-containing protein n=1 Tax=Streptomyces sp. CB02923 TaxID=1718985 RepID=UPI00093FF7EF|nr:glutathione synthase [Streptomyces sp. CB02923]OKI09693.1 glutathione synthase [Streptomyces sp. CB02923]
MGHKILVFVSRMDEYRLDNHLLIPNGLVRTGHEVHVADIETLGVQAGTVMCDMFAFDREYASGEPFPHKLLRRRSAESFDLVWLLTSPHPTLFLETYQLLWVLNQRVPFVNDAASVLFLNSKIALPAGIDRDHLPESYVSSQFDDLHGVVTSDPERSWIIKPGNEGCGADIYFLNAREKNHRALLQSATGNEVSRYENYGRSNIGLSRKYVTMQEYVPTVKENEKRVLLAGGEPICGFRRFHNDDDHRANATLGNKFAELVLTDDEEAYCRELGASLMKQGIYFAGIDLAFPYVLELNLENPGAINWTIRSTGVDKAPDVIKHLLAALERDGRVKPVSA